MQPPMQRSPALSVKTTEELERQIRVPQAEIDMARERQREAEDELKRNGISMKKFEEAWDTARDKANALAIDLSKAHTELKLQRETLEKVHGWAAKARPDLDLTPLRI